MFEFKVTHRICMARDIQYRKRVTNKWTTVVKSGIVEKYWRSLSVIDGTKNVTRLSSLVVSMFR